ncbi:ERRFI inhibitor, partial [Atractosteus spatula]|nr:ERRFI inhibitor [Atractosteus spatula]
MLAFSPKGMLDSQVAEILKRLEAVMSMLQELLEESCLLQAPSPSVQTAVSHHFLSELSDPGLLSVGLIALAYTEQPLPQMLVPVVTGLCKQNRILRNGRQAALLEDLNPGFAVNICHLSIRPNVLHLQREQAEVKEPKLLEVRVRQSLPDGCRLCLNEIPRRRSSEEGGGAMAEAWLCPSVPLTQWQGFCEEINALASFSQWAAESTPLGLQGSCPCRSLESGISDSFLTHAVSRSDTMKSATRAGGSEGGVRPGVYMFHMCMVFTYRKAFSFDQALRPVWLVVWGGRASPTAVKPKACRSRVCQQLQARKAGSFLVWMRPDSSWSMSTAGLAAQEIRVPLKSPFLHRTHCPSMASTRPYWDQHNDLDNLYFSLDPASLGYNLKPHQQVPVSLSFERQNSHHQSPQSPGAQRLPPKKSRPSQLVLPSCTDPFLSSSPEGDQVVPSFQRLSVYERTPPHTPGRGAKPLPPLPGPQSADLSLDEAVDSEVEFLTSSDDSCCLVPETCSKPLAFRYGVPSRRSFRGCGQINYAYFDGPSGSQIQEQQCQEESEQQQQQQQQQAASKDGAKQQDRDYRRWSAEVTSGGYSDEDKPPKVPPREPLSRNGSRTPSPKSLPTYLNGVMPPTQSFAPDPKYVSKGLQRQNSEGSPTCRAPCILPIIENGRKASTTHYFLLPQRPVYLDRFEKYFREAEAESGGGGPSTDSKWDCQAKRKHHAHVVSP